MRLLEKHSDFRERVLETDAPLVDIQQAVKWYFEESPQDKWDLHKDFHTLTAPNDITYMEYSVPTRININGKFQTNPHAGTPIGCIIINTPIKKEKRKSAQRDQVLERYVAGTYETAQPNMGIGKVWMDAFLNDMEWNKERENGMSLGITPSFILDAIMYSSPPTQNSPAIPIFRICMYLDEHGKAYDDGVGTLVFPSIGNFIYNASTDIEVQVRFQLFIPFAFALSLMNCKNVELIDDQRQLSRSARRKMQREKKPIVTYKWLHIRQLQKKVAADAGANPETRRHNRLHFVRAHWANYTADAPLFGKYEGTFFKPSHIKGRLSSGVALKDYKVDSPLTQEKLHGN